MGWYVWLPQKGVEIGAWTPVRVGDYVWTIGLSTPLSEVLASAGADRERKTTYLAWGIVEVVVLLLLAAWVRADIRQERSRRTLQTVREEATQWLNERAEQLVASNEALRVEMEKRERSEEQLRQAQKMEAIGRLAGGVAHDFNNLLVVINGYSQSLLSDLPLSHALRGDVEQIWEAGQRAIDLTRQLLTFSRRQTVSISVLNVNEILGQMAKMLQRLIGEHIELELQIDPDVYPVRADQGQLERAMMNLIVNARDAMPQGGKITITTSKDRPKPQPGAKEAKDVSSEYTCICVRDTGIGMSEETRQHIFEPFFTTKESGKGTGLGMATVYAIVLQSDGHVEIESVVGEGHGHLSLSAQGHYERA